MTSPRRLNDELRSLERLLLEMTDLVDAQLADAVNALLERDAELAETVAVRDQAVDMLELEIDRLVERLLALHSPVAVDLRTLIVAVKINTDLERIGDHCRNLARNTSDLPSTTNLLTLTRIPGMADLSRTMLRRLQEAFLQKDRLLARKVIATDLQVNRLHAHNIEALVTHSRSHPEHAVSMMRLISASKALERTADHIKNIAGNIVFLIEGVDLRRRARGAPPAQEIHR